MKKIIQSIILITVLYTSCCVPMYTKEEEFVLNQKESDSISKVNFYFADSSNKVFYYYTISNKLIDSSKNSSQNELKNKYLYNAISYLDTAILLDSSKILYKLYILKSLCYFNINNDSIAFKILHDYNLNLKQPEIYFFEGILYEKLNNLTLAIEKYKIALNLFENKKIKDLEVEHTILILKILIYEKEYVIKNLKEELKNDKCNMYLKVNIDFVKLFNRVKFLESYNF